MEFKAAVVAWHGGRVRGAQTAFARAVKSTQATVSRWMAGDYPPDEDTRPRVARALGITVDELLAMFPGKQRPPAGIDIQTRQEVYSFIPVLGVVAADRFAFSFDTVAEESVPNMWPGKKGIFSLRISGDCMKPTFQDGEIIYLQETGTAESGDIVLAQLDGQWTLKRYVQDARGIWLKPDNPKYAAIPVRTNKVTIRAKVLPYSIRNWRKP